MLIPARGDEITSRGGDPINQGMTARTRGGFHHIDHPAGFHRVRLIEDHHVRVQPIGRVFIRPEGFELAGGRFPVEVLDEHLNPRAQRGGGLDEPLAVVEHDARLLAFRRHAVPFGSRFPIEKREVERDERGLQRFPVLAREFVVRHPEAAQPGVRVHPREQTPEAESLMRLEQDVLPRPFPLVMPQGFREPEKPFRAPELPPIGESAPPLAIPIAEVPHSREPVKAPCRELPARHAIRVSIDRVHLWGGASGFSFRCEENPIRTRYPREPARNPEERRSGVRVRNRPARCAGW